MTRCSHRPTSRATPATMSASRRPIEDTIAYVRPNGEVRCSRPLSIRAATAVASRSASSKGTVLIDDLIQDRVEDRFRAETQQLRCLLQPAAHLGKIRRFGMADCDYELGTDAHVQLAELHLLHIIEISRRPQHREQCVAIPL